MTPPPKASLPPARAAALAAIEQSLPLGGKPGQDIQAALDNILRTVADPRDKALATELAYGYLRLKGRMDFLVRYHLAKPDKTHPAVIRILGVAGYELVHLDGIPARATLSWAVDAVKNRLGQVQANVANAVLRRVQSLGPDAAGQAFYDAAARTAQEALCAWHSCPSWLADLWNRDYGEATALELMRAQLRPPLFGIRVNAARPGARALFSSLSGRGGLTAADFPWLGFDPASSGAFLPDISRAESEGLLSRQSAAVGDILSRLRVSDWQGPLWDACAGRGGKTTALIELGQRRVLASDPNRRRLRGLLAEAERLGLPRPQIFLSDASRPPLKAFPGTILVDAPCSGLGVLARRPDAKWKRTPEDIRKLAAIQESITAACAALLPPGGRLVYMTCTMSRQENDLRGEAIESSGFKPEVLAEPVNADRLREFFWGGVWTKRG